MLVQSKNLRRELFNFTFFEFPFVPCLFTRRILPARIYKVLASYMLALKN
jgi:hypothetical protein